MPSDTAFRTEVVAALQAMSGRVLADDPAAWQTWWLEIPMVASPVRERPKTNRGLNASEDCAAADCLNVHETEHGMRAICVGFPLPGRTKVRTHSRRGRQSS